jgi:hypothetical protein
MQLGEGVRLAVQVPEGVLAGEDIADMAGLIVAALLGLELGVTDGDGKASIGTQPEG